MEMVLLGLLDMTMMLLLSGMVKGVVVLLVVKPNSAKFSWR